MFRSRLFMALALMISVLLVGVVGYMAIADLSVVEALYMTIITVTTVGYGEVVPLDDGARIFTVFLIVASVFIFGFAITVVSEQILERSYSSTFRRKRMAHRTRKLEDHVVVCGYGRNGQQAVQRLQAYGRPFVVVEKDGELVDRYTQEGLLFIEGDANEDEVLLRAGIDRARYLITAVPDDAVNLFIVLSARQLNPDLFIISRASQGSTVKKLEFAGADKVVMPDKIGGDHMASLVVMPDLITFMDELAIEGEDIANLEEVEISEFSDQIDCPTLRDLDLRNRTGCTIIGYVTPDGKYIINPGAEQMLENKGKVIVLGRAEQIQLLNEMFRLD